MVSRTSRDTTCSHQKAKFGTSLAFYRGQKGPSPENSKKSLKRGSGASRAQGQKSAKKVEKESKTSQKPEKNLKNSHFRHFFEFFRPWGPRGPGNPFSDFFRSFLGRGLFDPCRRPTISQSEITSFGHLQLHKDLQSQAAFYP